MPNRMRFPHHHILGFCIMRNPFGRWRRLGMDRNIEGQKTVWIGQFQVAWAGWRRG